MSIPPLNTLLVGHFGFFVWIILSITLYWIYRTFGPAKFIYKDKPKEIGYLELLWSTFTHWSIVLFIAYTVATYLTGCWPRKAYEPKSFSFIVVWPLHCRPLVVWGATVLFDFSAYIVHFLEHKLSFLYKKGHKYHHKAIKTFSSDGQSVTVYESLLLIQGSTAIANYVFYDIMNLCEWVALGYIVFMNIFLIHSDIHLPWDPLFRCIWILTPDEHQLHHAEPYPAKNFGHIYSYWDRLFGTYRGRYSESKDRKHSSNK